MSAAKYRILERLRKRQASTPSLPETLTQPLEFEAPLQVFLDIVPNVGGTAVLMNEGADLKDAITSAYPEASSILSIEVAEVSSNIEASGDPRKLQELDLCVVRGAFAVAENGAIWIRVPNEQLRVALVICEHLAIVVDRSQVVHNMHQAYQRIHFREPGYGTFISGPSKTADIEQCLVIGAHGPTSTTVFVA